VKYAVICSLTGQAQKGKDMSKTLTLNDEKVIRRKFEAIASFCDASRQFHFSGSTLLLTACFTSLEGEPEFTLALVPNEVNSAFHIKIAYVATAVAELGHDSLYLDPAVVLADLGKVPRTFASGEYWEIRNPADLEAFLRKYAWLSRVFQKKPLFDKLLV